MTSSSVLRHDRNKLRKWLRKWFGANRGTHWTIAGSVAVIIFGGYLAYNSRDANRATTITSERAPAPMTPAPLPSKR